MLSIYPGIRDYDMLRYHQLRYRFSDHDFLPLQWKAMQGAGWTYSGGKYKSPKTTLVFDNAKVIQMQLDTCAVLPTFNRLHFEHDLQSQCDSNELVELDTGKEHIVDLRNAICYHMQLIMEKLAAENVDENSMPGTGHCDSNDTLPSRDSSSRPANDAATDAAALRKERPLEISGVTAMEKGSDLYLRRTGRRSAPSNYAEKASRRKVDGPVASAYDTENVQSMPRFPSVSQCAEIMSSFGVEMCEQIEASHQLHDFMKWRFLLATNHSLLFYGNGSKFDLLSKFCELELSQEGYCLQVDGFDEDISMDGILDLLVSIFIDGKGTHQNENNSRDPSTETVVDRAVVVGKAIESKCRETGFPIFLIVHSLDGFLSTDIEQAALATLVRYSVPRHICGMGDLDSHQKIPLVAGLRLVASVDAVDAPAALWSSMASFDLSWIWNAVHTYRPYIREMAAHCRSDCSEDKTASKRRKVQQTRSLEQSERVLQVLQNLAPRYSEVMQILAQLQLTELRKSSQVWVDYKALRDACKSRFVVDKDSKLRTLQTELADHRLLVSKNEGPTEYVSIPCPEDKLLEILAFQRNSDR
jgi:Origin recognition complex subunit 2